MATKEEDNFLRIVYLNYRVGTTALRRFFDGVHPNLPSVLTSSSNQAKLSLMYKPLSGQRRVLYQEQWNMLYPSPGSTAVSSASLDVTLMVCLLRNLPPTVSPPALGFDALPQSSDSTHGAHIARIKYYKNFIVSHSKDGKLSDTDFKTIWTDLEMAIHGLGNQQDVTDAADAKSKVLDHNALREQVNFGYNIQHNLKRLNDHSIEIAVHTSKIRKLESSVENIDKEVQSIKKEVDVKTSKGAFKEFRDKLVRCTILDKQVLDNLISKCIMTVDDREDIDSLSDQSSRNQKLLEILIHRPYNTFSIFVEAVRESDQQCHTLLVADMEAIVTDKDLTLNHVPPKHDVAGVDKQTVKLIKWYKTLVYDLDIDKPGVLDKLSAKELTSKSNHTALELENRTQREKNRLLLGEIVRKNTSSAYNAFLEVLKEDSCCMEYATKIEETNITHFDLELLYIGKMMKNERKRKNGMTDFMIDKIEKWKKDDSLYIETRATTHVISCVNKHNCVIVIGPSGCGKTALVRHVALQMDRNGYMIFTVTEAKELKDQYKSDRKTLYIVDDMCGNFTANQSRIEEWKKSINDVQSILENSKYKLILTCRLQVFQDKGFENLEIFKTCECNLISKNLSLTSDEKEKFTMEYFKEHSSEALKHLGEYEFLPLLCKLYYVEKNNPYFTLETFLNDPFSFYKKELIHMYYDCIEGKYKLCALLLLVIHNNKLDENYLTGKNLNLKKHIKDILEVCDIHGNITGRTFKIQLDMLTGTFVTNDEGIYQTIHDKLFDFLAYYFGTQENFLVLLIRNAKRQIIMERFVVGNNTENVPYSIPISETKLKMYVKRVFDDMVNSSFVEIYIKGNRNFINAEFCNALRDFMKNLTKQEKIELIKTVKSRFLSTLFVLKEEDIKCYCDDKVECFGIVISDDLLQQYIEKLFEHLTKSDFVRPEISENRPLKTVSFRNAFRSYMRQLSAEQISFLIETVPADFLNEMFIMTEDGIKDNSMDRYKCFGIRIPDDLLQQYIVRWFYHLTKSKYPSIYMDFNRPLMNVTFRTAFQIYMKHQKTETIASLIQNGEGHFLNSMFVMRDDDIKQSANKLHECFGFVIPDDLLERYIEKWFEYFTRVKSLQPDMYYNRLLNNKTFVTAFCSYLKQLNTEKITYLIQTSSDDFFNELFVMTDDDIKYGTKNLYRRFGIVLPDSLLHQYIERLFDMLTKSGHPTFFIYENSLMKNDTFRTALRSFMKQLKPDKIDAIIEKGSGGFLNSMCVMRDYDITDDFVDKYHECFGFVIPDDLLQQFIERWFDYLSNSLCNEIEMRCNRQLMSLTFRTSLRSYTKQLDIKTIASFIQTGSDTFVKKMFVMTEEDIEENAENLLECVGIVIPVDLLQQYIVTWFRLFSYTDLDDIFGTRRHMSIAFRTAVRSYTKQLKAEEISAIIEFVDADFLITMFVMTDDDIKENAENQFDTIGIVIPDNSFQHYFERWFDGMTRSSSVDKYFDNSRCFNDVIFQISLRTYIKKLTKENIDSLIQTADWDFLNKMFVMTVEDIKSNAENHYECFGIVIPDEMLQQYIERWFDGMTDIDAQCALRLLKECTNVNRVLMNVKGRTAIQNFSKQINEDKIGTFIQESGTEFFNMMFVMTEEDFKDNTENRHECFGIIIPENLLQQYIGRWFDCLTNLYLDNIKDYINANRSAMNATFRVAFQNYIRQLSTEKIAIHIQSGEMDFVNSMYVMTEENVKNMSEDLYEHVGIVISDDLLQQFYERWFDNLTRCFSVKEYMNGSRCVRDVTFRIAIRNYIKQLSRVKILNLIQIGGRDFINNMFVMTEDDIKDNTENQCEGFGIVLSDEQIQKYIGRLFDDFIKNDSIKRNIDSNRCFMHVNFRKSIRNYIKQLPRAKIENLIQTGTRHFLNIMFVMTEDDIKDNTENRFECFGIVIPDELLHQYIGRWFNCITQTELQLYCPIGIVRPTLKEFFKINRLMMNVLGREAIQNYIRQTPKKTISTLIQRGSSDFVNTMFVTSEVYINDNTVNHNEYVGIIIPDDLIQQYIGRWFDDLTKTDSVREYMDRNRCVNDVEFRIALRIYIKQLTRRKIRNLHLTASRDFFNTMFVMREDDINENAEHQCECFGIIIPDDLLQQYIGRWFDGLTNADSVKKCIDANRCFKNDTFQISLRTFIEQLTRGKIGNLIQTGSRNFVNKMFVMTEFDIKENAENRLECFGVVIADDILKQYFQRWFDSITRTDSVKENMNVNRLLKNVEGQAAIQNYIRQINEEQTGTLILTGSTDFLNTMFVTTNDYIRDNAVNRYECFGIVLSSHLLQQYIGRLFDAMTKTDCVRKCIEANRCFLDFKFRKALNTYLKQLTSKKIGNLIITGSRDFVNAMFVMTEDDIIENAQNHNEYFGIVIPDDLLLQYIKIVFDGLTKSDSVMKIIDANRCCMNSTFRVALKTYIKQLTHGKIENLIITGSRDFVNTMFVMTDDDIKENSENRLECFGIVIPDDLLQQYIGLLFDGFTKADSVKKTIDANRCFMKSTFRVAIQTYLKQLTRGKIRDLIQSGSRDFVNSMFVTTEDDNKDNAENKYVCFGIILPEDLLQQYISRLVDVLTKTDSVRKCLGVNRCFMNTTFRISLQTYMTQLTQGNIANLIRTGSVDFVNTMFVIAEDDIKDDDETRKECFGVIIPDDLLHLYIERWFDGMTKTDSAKQYIDGNRTFMSSTFQANLDTLISGINSKRIEFLNRKGHIDYLNTRRDLIKETSEIMR